MDKMQRDQRSMVQLFFPLSLCTHGKIILPAEFVQFPYESFVIYGFFPCLRGHELAKVSPGFLSRRYMEIVRVHHRMRRNHHNGIRLQLRCHPGCLLVLSLIHIFPEDGRADDLIRLIQRHQTVHLASEADACHL